MKLTGAGIILKIHPDVVLLVKGIPSGKWSFPKGQIENNESLADCAIRETYEETCIHVRIAPKDHAIVFDKRKSTRCYFICTGKHVKSISLSALLQPKSHDPSEIEEVRHFHRSEWPSIRRKDVNMDVWCWLHPTPRVTYISSSQVHKASKRTKDDMIKHAQMCQLIYLLSGVLLDESDLTSPPQALTKDPSGQNLALHLHQYSPSTRVKTLADHKDQTWFAHGEMDHLEPNDLPVSSDLVST